jgi:hypothetical protein
MRHQTDLMAGAVQPTAQQVDDPFGAAVLPRRNRDHRVGNDKNSQNFTAAVSRSINQPMTGSASRSTWGRGAIVSGNQSHAKHQQSTDL